MKRAMQLLLERLDPRQPQTDDDSQTRIAIEFQKKAKQQSISRLAVQGTWRSSILFGKVEGGHLPVLLVAPLGPLGTSRPLLLPWLPYPLDWSNGGWLRGPSKVFDWQQVLVMAGIHDGVLTGHPYQWEEDNR